jgi:CubicO group peptidase (beta-lactamase class C family)
VLACSYWRDLYRFQELCAQRLDRSRRVLWSRACHGKKIHESKNKQALHSQPTPVDISRDSACSYHFILWYNDYWDSAQFSSTWINGVRVWGGMWFIIIPGRRWWIHVLFGRTSSVDGKLPCSVSSARTRLTNCLARYASSRGYRRCATVWQKSTKGERGWRKRRDW